ncbi:MAG: hypothetical protein BWY75_02146 [bacterium ADurb.Bin425]|nr:MAG: hypothetical protein BWY75_02146 [bacterium ADurb.Bin425]
MIRLYDQVLRHFLVTPRDAKRYLNALQFDITVVEDEVDVIDFAAIESLRLFASKAYEFIFSESDFFGVWASEYFDEHDSENSRHFLEGFLDKHYKKGDSLRNAIYNVIWFIFPNIHPQDYDRFEPIDDIEYYRRQRNICHPANFDTYFLLSTPASMISNAETKKFIDAANADQDITEHLSRIIDSDKGHSLSVKVLENIQSVSAAGARQIVGALCSNKSGFAFERGPFRCLRNEFIALTELLVEKSGSNDSERKQVVEKLVSSSGSLETWIRFLLYERNLIEEASKKSSQKDVRPVKKSASKPLAKEVVDAGIKALTQAIEHLDSEERLHTHPELQPILLYWDDLVSKKRRSEFIEKLLKRPLGAVALLTGFLAKGEIILAEAEDDEYQYRIPGVRLAIYALSKVVPIKCIRKLINAIDQTEIAKLDARQQLAITLLSNSKDDASFSKVVEEPVNDSAPTEPAAVEPVAAGKPS